MQAGFSAVQHTNHSRCEACDCNISYQDSLATKDLGYTVCGSLDCRRMMSQKSSMAPALFKAQLDFRKKNIHQFHQRNKARKKIIDEITEQERQENHDILQSVLDDSPGLSADELHLLVIPSGHPKLMPISQQRLETYTRHLNEIISAAAEYTTAAEVISDEQQKAENKNCSVEQQFTLSPGLRSISDSLCTLCKGGCCTSGKEHAYLSVYSMRLYMDQNPDVSSEDVQALYQSHIAAETIENSCINHTATGCALPRELRSNICNGYYCDGLESYHKKMAGRKDPKRVLAVQRSYTYWDRFEPDVNNDVVGVALVGVDGYLEIKM